MNPESAHRVRLLILSDIHFSGAAEQARGNDFNLRVIQNPAVRAFARFYNHFIWMRDPFARSPQLGRFLQAAPPADLVIVNGDYTANSAFVGLSDPAARASAEECLGKLKEKFGDRLHLTIGDHEIGKVVMFSGRGGMSLASWHTTTTQLGLKPFWRLTVGNYVLLGVASPLLALPVNRADTQPADWPEWHRLRAAHLAEIRAAFDDLRPEQRVLLFCHDPTALPLLAAEASVSRRLPQIEQTVIGHLHTELVMWKCRTFSGIPTIGFLGRYVKKFTSALNKAHAWRPFNVRLCPALAGIQLLNDGGYFTVDLNPAAQTPAEWTFHPLKR